MSIEFNSSTDDDDFVEIDAEELAEWLPSEENEEDDVSLSDVLDMEQDDGDVEDDENAYVSSSDVQQNPKQRQRMNDLKKRGYGAVSIYRDILDGAGELSELEDSISALSELVTDYGDPEALDELITLFGEIEEDFAESALGMVEEFFVEFATSEILSIGDSNLGESPEQVTIELQQQLVHALSLNMPGPRSALGRIFTAFSENSNFADDPQIQSLSYEFGKN